MNWGDLLSGSQWVVAVSAAGAALLIYGTRLGRAIAAMWRRVNEVFDIIAGREAIVHPETGVLLAEATPGLGHRLATMESAITSIADYREEIGTLNHRIDDLASSVQEHVRHTNLRDCSIREALVSLGARASDPVAGRTTTTIDTSTHTVASAVTPTPTPTP